MLFNKPMVLRSMLADLQHGEALYMRLDARRRDVKVPAHLVQEKLVLKIQPGVNAYRISELGLDAYLGFQTQWMWCFLPWHAIEQLAVPDKAVAVWSEGVEAGPPPNDVGEPTKVHYLRLIRGGREDLPIEPLPLSTG